MKTKTFISLVSLSLCVIISFMCLFHSISIASPTVDLNPERIPIVDKNNTRYISNYSSRSKSYTSLDELESNAQYVIAGKCISSEPIYQNQTLYTLSKLKIIDSYKGGMNTNDIINIIEMGGRTTFGDFENGCMLETKAFETDDLRLSENYNIVVGSDGFFPMKEGEEVLLFIGDTSGFLTDFNEPLYDIIGSYDGKFYKTSENAYIHANPSDTDDYAFSEESLTITVDKLYSKIAK